MLGIAVKVLAVLCALLRMSNSYIIGDKLLNKAYYVPGDLNVGGIFPVTSYHETSICGVSSFQTAIKTMEILETLAFAVEKINEDPNLLPDIKLGYVFLDSCSNHRAGVLQAIRFLPRLNERDTTTPSLVDNHLMSYNVIGVIGTSTSQITIPVSMLLGGAGIPLVSFADGSDELSNKKIHPTFLRLMPPDAVHNMAMLSFMKHNGWLFFSILIQDNDYGRINTKELNRISAEFGMCTSFVRRVSDKDDFKVIVNDLLTSTAAKVVVTIISHSAFAKLIKALKDLKAHGKFIWIGSNQFLEHLPFNEVLEGAFAVSSYPLELQGLKEYMSRVDLKKNPWVVREVLGNYFCQNSNCTHYFPHLNPGKLTLATPGIYDSMMTFAHGLQGLYDDLCPERSIASNFSSDCYYKNYGKLIRYLKSVNFTGASGQVNFNEKGDRLTLVHIYQSARKPKNSKTNEGNATILIQQVAYYDIKERKIFSFNNLTLQWAKFSLKQLGIQTQCQIPCLPNEYKSIFIYCCWRCRKCQPNEMVTDNGTACIPCPPLQWPAMMNDKLSTCELIEPTVFNWLEPLSVTILTVNGLGVVLILFVLVTLCVNQDESEEDGNGTSILVIIQLTAIAWGLMAVPVFLLRPTVFSCNTAHALYLLSFSVFYLALFLRTVDNYRKSLSDDEENELTLTKPKYLVILSVIIGTTQVITYSRLAVQHPIRSLSIQPTAGEKLVELICDIPFPHTTAFLINSVILLLMCSIFSLKSLADQYGFDKNRFVSMFVVTSLIMWIAFMPTYFTASSHRMRTYFLILAILVNHISALMLNFTTAFLELCIRTRRESNVLGLRFFRSSHHSGNTIFSNPKIKPPDKGNINKAKSPDLIKEPTITASDSLNDTK